MQTIIYLAVLILLLVGSLYVGKKYVFSKVRINKWITLAISLIAFIGQFFVQSYVILTPIAKIVTDMMFTLVIVWFFLWFLEIQTTGGPKKPEKKIQIRPKAKPNRVKHLQNKK